MSLPPTYQTSIFNSAFFSNSTDPLTLDVADKRYLQLGGGEITGSLFVSNIIDASAYKLSGTDLDFTNLGLLSGITAGLAQASKILSTDSSNALSGLSLLRFATSNSQGSRFQTTTISGSNGIQVYTLVDSTNGYPAIDFYAANGGAGASGLHFMRFGGYQQYTNSAIYGNPWGIVGKDGTNGLAGLHITSTGTGSTVPGSNVHMSVRNGTVPVFSASDEFQAAHILGTAASINSNPSVYKCQINQPTEIHADTTALLLTNTGGSADRTEIQLQGNSALWQIGAGNSAHGTAPNSFYFYNGSYRMIITSGGNMGIGTTSPSCALDVATGSSVTTTTNIAINTYSVSLNGGAAVSSVNQGGGPFSATMCARFRSNIWVQSSIYATSDRRLKEAIMPLDFSLEHYMKLRPVSFRYTDEPNTKLGLIAQDMLGICSESLMISDNPNLKVEQDGDIEGVQLGVDYNAINMMSVVAIKKLIQRNEELQSMISDLQQRHAETILRLFELEKH